MLQRISSFKVDLPKHDSLLQYKHRKKKLSETWREKEREREREREREKGKRVRDTIVKKGAFVIVGPPF